jgi:hypothetical protein
MNSSCAEKSLFRNGSVKYPRKSVKRAKRTTLIAGIASDLISVIFILFSLYLSTIFDSLSHFVWLRETANKTEALGTGRPASFLFGRRAPGRF